MSPAGHFESEAVDDGAGGYLPGEAVWTTYRQPDAVRAAALANAIDLACADIQAGRTSTVGGIMDLARTFEAYLTGEEANGTN